MNSKIKKVLALAIAVIVAISMATVSFARYKGDINNDGTVNSSDALIALQYAVGSITEIDKVAADMDNDGLINSNDALAILRTSVGSLDKVEIEEAPENPENPENPDTPDAPSVPESKEDIVALYNEAINKVVNDKAGYNKQRTTTVSELDAGSYTSVASGIVKDFLGEGTKEVKNSKGTAKHLQASTLTASDVASATCELVGNNYTITLNLEDGTSSATKSSKKDDSAIAKCGLVTGKSVSDTIDYINSECIYSSITAEKITVGKITATNNNAKIVVVIDAETGNMISYTTSFDWAAEISNLSTGSGLLAIKISKATGKAHTAVVISDFQW